MAILSKTLEADLKALNMSFNLINNSDYRCEDVSAKDADEITIYDYNNGIDFKSFRLPQKKLVDIDWVMNKYNSERVYKSFSEDFKKLLLLKGYKNSINVYPTTYGIGIFVAFGHRDSLREMKADIDSLMVETGIDFRNEYSDAGYVFRYKISKSKDNIEKMKQTNINN